MLDEFERTAEQTASNDGMTLCLAVNYGGRTEISDAARRLAEDVQAGRVEPDQVDESLFASYLCTAGMSDPDLLIRTAGEMRISNFLLWQISYAELWITPTLWPDFRGDDLLQACRAFAARERKFGGLPSPSPERSPQAVRSRVEYAPRGCDSRLRICHAPFERSHDVRASSIADRSLVTQQRTTDLTAQPRAINYAQHTSRVRLVDGRRAAAGALDR